MDADSKISELPIITEINTNSILVIVQRGITSQIQFSNLLNNQIFDGGGV